MLNLLCADSFVCAFDTSNPSLFNAFTHPGFFIVVTRQKRHRCFSVTVASHGVVLLSGSRLDQFSLERSLHSIFDLLLLQLLLTDSVSFLDFSIQHLFEVPSDFIAQQKSSYLINNVLKSFGLFLSLFPQVVHEFANRHHEGSNKGLRETHCDVIVHVARHSRTEQSVRG